MMGHPLKIGLYATGTANCGYQDLFDQVERAEEAGFDSVWLRERHFHADDAGRNFYSAPLAVATYIAARTRRMRIGIGARILPLEHPIHIAEDAATLDIISGGRLDFGIARIGENSLYQSAFGVADEESRGRFEESLEVILKAWTCDSFSHQGRYYQIPQVHVAPKPVQKPHPPVYLVGIGPATLDFGARRGFPLLLAAAQTAGVLRATQDTYRQLLQNHGHDAESIVLPVNRFIYVADSDAEAISDTRETVMRFIHRENSVIRDFLMLPKEQITYDLLFNEVCIFGSADYCLKRLAALREQVDLRHLIASFNYFTIDHDKCVRSMERFIKAVMPALRAALGRG